MKKKRVICIVIAIMLVFSSTSTCYIFATENREIIQEKSIIIEGQKYLLLPAEDCKEVVARDNVNYDWTRSYYAKTSKHFRSATQGFIIGYITDLLFGIPGLTLKALASAILSSTAAAALSGANVYFEHLVYYAKNIGNTGGYPYYCKEVFIAYKDKARTKLIGSTIDYYYAYQPY